MKLSIEHREKISMALRGRKKPPFTNQHRMNISKSKTGLKTGMSEKRFKHLSRLWKLPRTKKQLDGLARGTKAAALTPWTEERREYARRFCSKIGKISKNDQQKEWCRKLGSSNFGEKHPNWKGGKTVLSSLIKSSIKYKRWSRSVFVRDGFTCRKCGKYNCKIECHHKKPFRTIFLEFLNSYPHLSPIEDKFVLLKLSFKYEDFWQIGNGETLCVACHNETRREYFRCLNTLS